MAFGKFAPLPLRLGGNQREGWAPEEHARFCADLVAVSRTSAYATFAYSISGSTVTVSGYAGRNGNGLAYKPTATYHGTGDVTFTWPAVHLDPYKNAVSPAFKAAVVQLNGVAAGFATYQLTANSIRIRTTDDAGVTSSFPATVRVWGEAGTAQKAIGDYGGSPDKRASESEGQIPYAAQWYREFQAARGDAYTTKDYTLVACENLALARLYGTWASRFPEKRRANAMPHRSDEKLDYWVEVLGVPTRADDPKWLIRQRCAAHFKASKGPVADNIRQALEELLGDLLIDVLYTTGADLATPPDSTIWPGVNPGIPAYDLGGGTWMSRRCHLLVQVERPSSQELGRFKQLLEVDMQRLLDTMLPATATFSWVIFDNSSGVEGFFLDISPLDLTGMT